MSRLEAENFTAGQRGDSQWSLRVAHGQHVFHWKQYNKSQGRQPARLEGDTGASQEEPVRSQRRRSLRNSVLWG